MNDNLYFLHLIADALEKPDPKKALKKAFQDIKNLGRQPKYEQGFLQFQRFMKEVRRNWEKQSEIQESMTEYFIHDLALQLSTGLFEDDEKETEAALNLIKSRPEWQQELEKLLLETARSEVPDSIPEIIIEKEGKPIDSIPFENRPASKTINNLKPGLYTITLDTGRVLWQDRLTEKDLLWIYAFPEKDLAMAADTGEGKARTTREIELLGGEVTIRVFPEIESGRLELKIKS